MVDFLDYAKNFIQKPGQKRLLSDRVRIFVKSEGKIIRVGELDSFSATKRDNIRTFRPCGETREIAQLEDRGWDLSFSGGKVDWNLARLLHKQELLFNSRKPSEGAIGAPSFLGIGLPGMGTIDNKIVHIEPKFDVEHSIIHFNGSMESYIYEDVVLYNYSIDIGSDLEPIKETFKGHSPRKTRAGSTFIVDELITPGAASVVDGLISSILENERSNSGKTAINTPPRGHKPFSVAINTPPRGITNDINTPPRG